MLNQQYVYDRPIRVGVVGCGRIARNHFASIKAHADELELVAICDSDAVVLESAQRELRVPGYTSLGAMLDGESLDLVSLCTPSGLHSQQAVLAAAHGVHVISEKPMATRWEDARRMVESADRAGVRLFVVKQNRRNSTLQLLKRAVTENRFGRIRLVQVNVFWTRPQSYYDQATWRGTWEFDGGAFMNQASHYVDLLSWLVGPVQTVHAMTSTALNIEAEDTGVLNVRWRSGALGSMSVTMLTYPNNLEGSITILGDAGTARVGGVAVNEVQVWKFSDQRDYDQQLNQVSYETTSVYGMGHPLYYQNVVDVLRGRALPETDGREGLKSLEVLLAAYLSARDGKEVSLPLQY